MFGALPDRPNAYGTAMLADASAAMEALARGLALELAPTRVNALSPGITDMPLLGRAFGDGLDAFVSDLKEKLPLHRLVTAAEASTAVVFLMTNGEMNGETLYVDGLSRLVRAVCGLLRSPHKIQPCVHTKSASSIAFTRFVAGSRLRCLQAAKTRCDILC